jgi:hypothetical protein
MVFPIKPILPQTPWKKWEKLLRGPEIKFRLQGKKRKKLVVK